MNVILLKRQLGRINTCMTIAKAEHIFKILGEIRNRTNNIEEEGISTSFLHEQLEYISMEQAKSELI
jgi:hypothetical protein